jgi:predicted MPP superfamily phosphohydrolase
MEAEPLSEEPAAPANAQARRISRRKFIGLCCAGLPVVAAMDAFFLEPAWVDVNTIRLSDSPSKRLVQFTDTHFKGDTRYMTGVIDRINRLNPDLVLFTGDLVEHAEFLDEALAIFAKLDKPLYGVPGNHDYWSQSDFSVISNAFETTGGAWLVAETAIVDDVELVGIKEQDVTKFGERQAERRIMLTHYPATVDKLKNADFDLVLAGHSHGGQVRLPFVGPLILPGGVGDYDRGFYDTPAGPLYVNTGIGTYGPPVRFLCRPEITVFEI